MHIHNSLSRFTHLQEEEGKKVKQCRGIRTESVMGVSIEYEAESWMQASAVVGKSCGSQADCPEF